MRIIGIILVLLLEFNPVYAINIWVQSNWSGGAGYLNFITNNVYLSNTAGIAALNDGIILGKENNIVIENAPRAINYTSYWSYKNIGMPGNDHLSQSFTAVGSTLSEVMLGLSRVGTPSSNLVVSIRSSLTGADLMTAVVSNSSITANNYQYPNQVTIRFPSVLQTTINSAYYIYVKALRSDAVNYYRWSLKINNPYTNGQGYDSSDADAGGDYFCRVGLWQSNVSASNYGTTAGGQGVSRPYDLINTNRIAYDGSSGYAYFTWSPPAGNYFQTILPSVKEINQIRTLLWDGDARNYQYYISVSENGSTWTTVVNKQTGNNWKSWQSDVIAPVKAKYIRTYGTYNSANNGWHAVEQEVFQALKSDEGYLISSVFSNASTNVSYGHIYLSHNGENEIKVKIRTGRNNDMSTALPWPSCPYLTNNQLLPGVLGVTNGKRFIQYRVELNRIGDPKLQKIEIEYNLPPGPPAGSHTINGASLNHTDKLVWAPGNDPDSQSTLKYNIKLSTNASFTGITTITSNIASTNVFICYLNERFAPSGKKVYWQAQTSDELGSVSRFTNFGFYFYINSASPNMPALLTPVQNGEIKPQSLVPEKDTFQWIGTDPDTGDGLNFTLILSTNFLLLDPVSVTSNVTNSMSVTNFFIKATNVNNYSSLKDDTYYFWQISPFDNHEEAGTPSSTFKAFFNPTNDPPAEATNLRIMESIAPDGMLNDWDSFMWHWDPRGSDIFDSVKYRLQISPSTNFSPLTINVYPIDLTNVIVSNLSGYVNMIGGQTYYWRIKVDDQQGQQSAWASAKTNGNWAPFIRSSGSYIQPSVPVSPANNSTISHSYPLKWNIVEPKAKTNDIMLGTNSSFHGYFSITSNITGTSNYFYQLKNSRFPGNHIFYWRLHTKNTNGIYSYWNAAVISNFFLSVPPPSKPHILYPTNNGQIDLVSTSSNLLGLKWISWDNLVMIDTNDYFYSQLTLSSNSSLASPLSIHLITNRSRTSNFFIWFTNVNNYSSFRDNTYYYYSIRSWNNHQAATDATTVCRFYCNLSNSAPNSPNNLRVYLPGYIETPNLYSNVSFQWSWSPHISDPTNVRYEFQIYTNSIASGNLFDTNTLYVKSFPITNLNNFNQFTTNKLYYWRVRTVDDRNAASAWSAAQTNGVYLGYCFFFGNQAPRKVPSLLTPKGSALSFNSKLEWMPSFDPEGDAIHYKMQISVNSDFTPLLYERGPIYNTDELIENPVYGNQACTNLKSGCLYYWRVYTIDNKDLTNSGIPVRSYFYMAVTNDKETYSNTRCMYAYEPFVYSVRDKLQY
ncbi:MAG: discoidin domain-containing protein, partial [bacterium]|nr:discoidin domain-containing protein [bacterium]